MRGDRRAGHKGSGVRRPRAAPKRRRQPLGGKRLRRNRILTAAILLAGLMLYRPARALFLEKAEERALRARLEKVEEANRLLEQERRRLEDPEYVKKLARERLNMVEPGETPLFLPEPSSAPTPAPKPGPWWEGFLQRIGRLLGRR